MPSPPHHTPGFLNALCRHLPVMVLFVFLLALPLNLEAQEETKDCKAQTHVPFSVNETHLTVWNGSQYVPIFVKGINLGVAVPGTFAGQLAASRQQYREWFTLIREAGFNTIRLYTLHFPRFYEELEAFNSSHPKEPLYVLQGIWLEGQLEGYQDDLYFLTDTFDYQIREAIDCIHGNRQIPQRRGKAWGSYTADVSDWILGYIPGREVIPREVLTTNANHPDHTRYQGDHFSLPSGSPVERWITQRLDRLAEYEQSVYGVERPVSFSSWPTLDPLEHDETFPEEDTASIDLANIQFADTAAGYFASYHAYPYYPDFISTDPEYQQYSDHIGQNSYLGYLHDLKSHYNRFPLIIGEYGVPSSWGIAHYSYTGTHHGGSNEVEQGRSDIRLLKNIQQSQCGGGIQFSWIDEWWKPTWVTAPVDYLAHRRPYWHNITAAEQNFGLLKFVQEDNTYQHWQTFPDKPVDTILTGHDYSFFHLRLALNESLQPMDSIWIALDTYWQDVGEKILPTGDTIVNRAEFALKITNFEAEMYVTEAYDQYGILFGGSTPEQKYRSVPTTGAPWNILRWRNNVGALDIQYIGDMQTRYRSIAPSSRDAVVISENLIDIRLPWSLLHYVDPSMRRVIHDDRATAEREDTISDGIAVSVYYHGSRMTPSTRYTWETWNTVRDVRTVKKTSYYIVKDQLHQFNNQPVARCNTYEARQNQTLEVPVANGILANDFDIDGNAFHISATRGPAHGTLDLSDDGSFLYNPFRDFVGLDRFRYTIIDEYGQSDTARVYIQVSNPRKEQLFLYPNPAKESLHVTVDGFSDRYRLQIRDIRGTLMMEKLIGTGEKTIDVSSIPAGTYIMIIDTGRNRITRRFIIL
jgi:hypothetical protein